METSRRGFLGILAAGVAAASDPDILLWTPGRKVISIPPMVTLPRLHHFGVTFESPWEGYAPSGFGGERERRNVAQAARALSARVKRDLAGGRQPQYLAPANLSSQVEYDGVHAQMLDMRNVRLRIAYDPITRPRTGTLSVTVKA